MPQPSDNISIGHCFAFSLEVFLQHFNNKHTALQVFLKSDGHPKLSAFFNMRKPGHLK